MSPRSFDVSCFDLYISHLIQMFILRLVRLLRPEEQCTLRLVEGGAVNLRKAAKLVCYFLSPQENRFVTSCPHKSRILALTWCVNKLRII